MPSLKIFNLALDSVNFPLTEGRRIVKPPEETQAIGSLTERMGNFSYKLCFYKDITRQEVTRFLNTFTVFELQNFFCRDKHFANKATEGDKSDTTTPTGGKDTTSPQTGDNSNMLLWVALLFVSGAGVLGTTVYSKKKRVR